MLPLVMIPLMDDFTHIGAACERLATNPSDRFAIVAINCGLGESVDATRFAALLVTFATLFILDRLFFEGVKDRLKRLALWAVHPLVLLPFFWASQFTTAATTFWGVVWTQLFVSMIRADKVAFRHVGPFLLWSGLGATVRFEALAYGCAILTTYLVWSRFSESKSDYLRFFAKKKVVLVAFVSSVVSILIGKHLLKFVPSNGVSFTIQQVATEAITKERFYPNWVWPFLQFDSLGRYLESVFLPWKLSFYGNWYHWWDIHQRPWVGFAHLSLVWAAIAAILILLRYRYSQKSNVRLAWIGIAFFCLWTLMLSGLPRNDWYYPIRAYLGTLCLLVFFTPILTKRKVIYGFCLFLFAGSSALHLAAHFSSDSDFIAYEEEIANGDHPFQSIHEALLLKRSGKLDEAIQLLHQVYSKIPVDSAELSNRAGSLWTLSLYHAWLIYEEQGNAEKSAQTYKIMMQSSFYPSVHACLQSDQTPVEDCLRGERLANFCGSFSHLMPKLDTVRDYRVSVKDICPQAYQQK